MHACALDLLQGSVALGKQLEAELRAQGLNPLVIPVGGSNSLGTWGYLQVRGG